MILRLTDWEVRRTSGLSAPQDHSPFATGEKIPLWKRLSPHFLGLSNPYLKDNTYQCRSAANVNSNSIYRVQNSAILLEIHPLAAVDRVDTTHVFVNRNNSHLFIDTDFHFSSFQDFGFRFGSQVERIDLRIQGGVHESTHTTYFTRCLLRRRNASTSLTLASTVRPNQLIQATVYI